MQKGPQERVRRAYLRERRAVRQHVTRTADPEVLVTVGCIALVMGVLTYLANHVLAVSFLVFPPLVAATYRLFTSDPDRGRVPWGFTLGLTGGAMSGWLAVVLVRSFGGTAALGSYRLTAVTATVTVCLAGGTLWALDVDLPPALAVGLLLPFAGVPPTAYVVNVVVASLLVTGVYAGWRLLARNCTVPSTLLHL